MASLWNKFFDKKQYTFEVANEHFINKKLDNALSLFLEVKNTHHLAGVKITEIEVEKVLQNQSGRPYNEVIEGFNEALEFRKTLQITFNQADYADIDNKVQSNIRALKYNKGCELFRFKRLEQALKLFQEIEDKYKDAREKVFEVKIGQANNIAKDNSDKGLDRLLLLSKQLESKKKDLSAKAFKDLNVNIEQLVAKIYLQKAKDAVFNQDTSRVIFWYEKALESSQYLHSSEKNEVYLTLTQIYFQKGKEEESTSNFDHALLHYQKAKNEFSSLPKRYIENENTALLLQERILCRIGIIQLKTGKNPSSDILKSIEKSILNCKDELYFRYALYFAKKQEIKKALIYAEVINRKNTDVNNLITYCKEFTLQSAVKQVHFVNAVIFSSELPRIQSLHNNFAVVSKTILNGLPHLKKKLEILKPYLFSRLVSLLFENEKFEDVIEIIYKYPKFYESPELLKNIGIASLYLVKNDLLTRRNYKKIISNWLAAVYSDKVLIHSLDYTEWDDAYTFTLIESIGGTTSLEGFDIENVNFNEIKDQNISIGATQKELVREFEEVLSKAELQKSINALEFYNQEKEALERLVDISNDDLLGVPPYFATQLGLHRPITDYLLRCYKLEHDEEILEIGLPYSYYSDNLIGQYQEAKTFLKQTLDAVETYSSSKLQSLNTTANRDVIYKFDNVKKDFEAHLVQKLEKAIENKSVNYDIVELLEAAINLSPTTGHLKFLTSNCIVDDVISKMNSNKINNKKGLQMLIKAYNLTPENSRITQNLSTIVKFNCADILNETARGGVKGILKDLVRKRNKLLKLCLRQDLTDMLYGFINQMDNANPTVGKMMRRRLGMNVGFSIPPSGISLNAAGEKMIGNLKIIKNLID